MKEAIITKIIPKIHRYIFFGLGAVFFLVFFTFIALLEGIRFDRLSYQGLIIEQLYLKWENSLLISASKIDLTHYKSDDEPLSLKPLEKLPPLIRNTQPWIKEIHIQSLQYKSLSLRLDYQRGSEGKILLRDQNRSYSGLFHLDEHRFSLSLPRWSYEGAYFKTNLFIDLPRQLLRTDIVIDIQDTPTLFIKGSGDQNTISLNAQFNERLQTIKPLIKFFRIDPKVEPWIIDYLQASSIELERLEGIFHYNNPEELLTSLKGEATVYEASYTFAEGFEPIHSPKVNLSFSNGKLHISPQNGTFYNLPTEKSHLSFDFTAPHTLLDIHLESQYAVLNSPILKLLQYYEIDLPIQQTSGTCAVYLDLNVDLHTYKTKAKGVFKPSSTEVLLGSTPLYSDGGIVTLNDTYVTFENFSVHYGEDVAHARVSGEYEASTQRGAVNIEAYDISPLSDKELLHLYNSQNPLKVTYLITPKGDELQVKPSLWNFMGEKLFIEEFRAPFNYQKTSGVLHSVSFLLANSIQGKLSALFDGQNQNSDIQVTINSFNLDEMKLAHTPFTLDIHYNNDTIQFHSYQSSAWNLHQLPILVSPFSASIHKNRLTFDPVETLIGDLFKGRISGNYSLNTLKGIVTLDNLTPLSPKIAPLVDSQDRLELTMDASGKEIVLDANQLKTRFMTIPNGWKIQMDEIALLSRHSPLLRQYHIKEGNINLYYSPKTNIYTFDGNLYYPYPLMMINTKAVSKYRFSGIHHEGDTSIRVNDRLIIRRNEENIVIKAKNMGINLPELFKFLSSQQQSNKPTVSKEGYQPSIKIYGDNSYLFLMKDRKIMADRLEATINNDAFDASLYHMDGKATLTIRNGIFFMDGKGFNDKFMEHLFALSDFYGGTFSFQSKGTFDKFEGLMRVENTVLKEYKILNNVLAFINTVPSLATFSLPNYHSKGLPVQEGYAHFNYENDRLRVDNFTLNSPEMKILGEGEADMKTDTLNGSLTFKTDLGSALGKIPMVGYILLGDDGSISTTVSISGKLDDPKVETAIAKEIVTAPFNILKRTVVYPFLWMIDDKKKK